MIEIDKDEFKDILDEIKEFQSQTLITENVSALGRYLAWKKGSRLTFDQVIHLMTYQI